MMKKYLFFVLVNIIFYLIIPKNVLAVWNGLSTDPTYFYSIACTSPACPSSNLGQNWTYEISNAGPPGGSYTGGETVGITFYAYWCASSGDSYCDSSSSDYLNVSTAQGFTITAPIPGNSTPPAERILGISSTNYPCGTVQADLGPTAGGGIIGGSIYDTGINCPLSAPSSTSLSASCPAPGNSATLSWQKVTGARYYSLRIDYNPTSFNYDNSCVSTGDNTGDICNLDYEAISNTFSSIAGGSYHWTVAACDDTAKLGYSCSGQTAANFDCATSPSSTPTSTPTPTSTSNPKPATFDFTVGSPGDISLTKGIADQGHGVTVTQRTVATAEPVTLTLVDNTSTHNLIAASAIGGATVNLNSSTISCTPSTSSSPPSCTSNIIFDISSATPGTYSGLVIKGTSTSVPGGEFSSPPFSVTITAPSQPDLITVALSNLSSNIPTNLDHVSATSGTNINNLGAYIKSVGNPGVNVQTTARLRYASTASTSPSSLNTILTKPVIAPGAGASSVIWNAVDGINMNIIGDHLYEICANTDATGAHSSSFTEDYTNNCSTGIITITAAGATCPTSTTGYSCASSSPGSTCSVQSGYTCSVSGQSCYFCPPAVPTSSPAPTTPPSGTTYAVQGFVFTDTNSNGIKDSNESCYSGLVTVHLSGPTSKPDIQYTQDSACTNQYTFAGLAAGNYIITITPVTNYSSTNTPIWTQTVSFP